MDQTKPKSLDKSSLWDIWLSCLLISVSVVCVCVCVCGNASELLPAWYWLEASWLCLPRWAELTRLNTVQALAGCSLFACATCDCGLQPGTDPRSNYAPRVCGKRKKERKNKRLVFLNHGKLAAPVARGLGLWPFRAAEEGKWGRAVCTVTVNNKDMLHRRESLIST